jgi:hypothetical protein
MQAVPLKHQHRCAFFDPVSFKPLFKLRSTIHYFILRLAFFLQSSDRAWHHATLSSFLADSDALPQQSAAFIKLRALSCSIALAVMVLYLAFIIPPVALLMASSE